MTSDDLWVLSLSTCEAGFLLCDSAPGCRVDGAWGQWGPWTGCSLSCGGGEKLRKRLCDNPPPEGGARGCVGVAEQQKACNTQQCTGDSGGPWWSWSQWSVCSVSCGGGQQARSRLCSSCEHGRWNCSLDPCPVHGGFSGWTSWTSCSLSCGGLGVKTRSRLCTHPVPAHGGRDCQGPRVDTTYCQAPECPVDGGWSRWSPWSLCDKQCGGGRSLRTRSCSSPPPKNGGKVCEGEKNQVKACNTKPCGNPENVNLPK
uniref:Properdin n=1 Tax=Gouania willdenowi TaxID=441366 RepID=A0A8C5EUW8_GOUWI